MSKSNAFFISFKQERLKKNLQVLRELLRVNQSNKRFGYTVELNEKRNENDSSERMKLIFRVNQNVSSSKKGHLTTIN